MYERKIIGFLRCMNLLGRYRFKGSLKLAGIVLTDVPTCLETRHASMLQLQGYCDSTVLIAQLNSNYILVYKGSSF